VDEGERLLVTATLPRPTGDIPTVVIEPSRGWASLKLGAVWEYRELFIGAERWRTRISR
jgi:hypothetical protein